MANYNSSYTGAQIDSAVGRANSTDVTAGTVTASKSVVVDSNKDITGFRHITATGTITADSFTATGNTTIGDAATDTLAINSTITTNLIFEGSTADAYELTLTPGDPTADRTITLPDATDTLVGKATTDTLTNKTLTAPDINAGTVDAITSLTVANNVDIGAYDLRAATLTADGLTSGRVVFAGTNGVLSDDSDLSFSGATLSATNVTSSGTMTFGTLTDSGESIAVTKFVDEGDGISSNDNDTTIPTSAAVKDYVDTQLTAEDLDLTSDSGTIAIDLDSETLTIAGGEGIDTSATSNTLTITAEEASSSNKGVASFSTDNFSVSSGVVTIKDDGVILATETTGDFVNSITGGTGIDSTGATSGENISHTLSLDLNELTTETSIADDDFIAMVDATDSASGKITFENLEDAIFASVSGDITITEAGVATIANNAVALGTDTTGNYVATIADSGGGGITVANSGAESAAVTLELDIKGLTEDSIASGDFIAFSDEGESGDPANRETIDDVATLFAGTGLTASSAVINIDAAQTGITSLLATDIKIGEDNETKIDFEDANKINFYAGNEKQLILEDGALYPGSDNIIDLGKSDNEFKDGFFDGTVTADAFAGPLTGAVTGNADTATLASTVTVADSTANTNFPVVFHNESNGLLDDTGALRYNPSTGELLVPKLTVAGTTTTVDTVTMNAANAIIFEGATADANETTLSIVDPTSDHTQYLINQGGYIPLLAAATTTAITSTPAELNILDGATLTVAELNLLDGVTSTTAELNILDGVTSTAAELNILDGVTSTAAELNILDGVTASAAEINLIDGGTARGTTAVASGDGILINDGGTMRMTNVDTVSTYFSSHNVGGGNIVTTGALNSGSITSGFGAIDTGSSNITTTGVGTFGSLDIEGDVDVNGTLETDALTINGTTLAETISDTVGAMVGSNTETGIAVTYEDGDNTLDFALAAAQTTITSLLATDIKIGEDDQTKIDFETADEIHFYAANVEQVYLGDNIFGPQSDSDVDLGSSSVRWKDAYVDSLTVTGAISASGNTTITGDEQALTVTTGDSGRVGIVLQNSDTGSDTDFSDGLVIKLDSDETGQIGMAENKALNFMTNGANRITIANNGPITMAENLIIDSARSVGIGVTPSYKFTVKSAGEGSIANSGIVIENNDDTDLAVALFEENTSPTTGQMRLYSGGSEKVQINGNGVSYFNGGNVGIGTTSPASVSTGISNFAPKLDIRGGTGTGVATAGAMILSTAETTIADGDYLGMIAFQAPLEGSGTDAILSPASIHAEAEVAFDGSSNSTSIVFSTADSTAPIERMRIHGEGNIGIGVTPLKQFHIQRTDGAEMRLSSNAQDLNSNDNIGTIQFSNNNDATGAIIKAVASDNWATNDYPTDIVFFNTPDGGSDLKERLRIRANGSISTTHASGVSNSTAFGDGAGIALASGANYNTFLGVKAGEANTTADSNTFVGYQAGKTITTGGENNTGMGVNALVALTSGDRNVAIGDSAGLNMTAGSECVFIGAGAGQDSNHTDGDGTVCVGYQAGYDLVEARKSTAIGYQALHDAVNNDNNTAVGYTAGAAIDTGARNTILGTQAGTSITSGNDNVCIGNAAGDTLADANGCVIIGHNSDAVSDANYANVMGHNITGTATQRSRIGAGSNYVELDHSTSGNGWANTSDVRIKKDIVSVDLGLNFINSLRPVKYKEKPLKDWPKEFLAKDTEEDLNFKNDKEFVGFISQEVKEIMDKNNTTFSGWQVDEKSSRESLQYDKFVVPLVKAVQELSAKVTELESKCNCE